MNPSLKRIRTQVQEPDQDPCLVQDPNPFKFKKLDLDLYQGQEPDLFQDQEPDLDHYQVQGPD